MQFSIVVPTFNYANYLKNNLDSLFQQNYKDFEVILVDDGSTDHTKTIASEYSHQYREQFHYIYQQNAGPAAARNNGLKQAQGDYIIFLDSDDALKDQALNILAKAINEHHVDLIIGRHITISAQGKRKESISNRITNNCEYNFSSYIRKKISLANGAYAIKKSALKEFDFPQNLKGREDILFFALMLANLSSVAINDILVAVNKHQDSLRHSMPDMNQTGLLTALLFEHAAMPVHLKKYRKEFESRLYLSLFRQFYKAEQYKKAQQLYIQAIKIFPKHIFLWSYLKRFLISILNEKKK